MCGRGCFGASAVLPRTGPSPCKLATLLVFSWTASSSDGILASLVVLSWSIPAEQAMPSMETSKHSIMSHVADANLPEPKTSS